MTNSSSPLSVLFVGGCLYTESSGVHLSLLQTTKTLAQQGHSVTVVGTSHRPFHQAEDWPVEAIAFKRYGPFSLHFAPGIDQWLKNSQRRWDVASLQGAWIYLNVPVTKFCQKHNIPTMISTHGMFNERALNSSAWKKALARSTFLKATFEQVKCYQVGTETEYNILRQQGIKKPICIIGNGIEIPSLPEQGSLSNLIPFTLGQRQTCLYVGRLNPIKGLDNLLRAWADLHPSDSWQLIIGGTGDANYRSYLEQIVQEEKCVNVHFLGYLSQEEKTAWLRQADFCVLPSQSEGFAMFPMESFAAQKPVLMTTACGFPESVEWGASIAVEPSVEGLKNGLSSFVNMTDAERQKMGDQALTFIDKKYNWQTICTQLHEVYQWMLGSGHIPDCLCLN